MSACPYASDWMAAATGPAGRRGCSLPEGQTFHDTTIATNSAVTWPPGTNIGRVRITKSILRDRDPCALLDLIAETVRRNPEITTFHVRPSGADYSSLLESLSARLPSDHTRIHSHYMAAHLVDAEPPTTLRFTSTKPKPTTFAKEGWHKEAASGSCFSSIRGSPLRRPFPSTRSPVAQRGNGTATAPGSPCRVRIRPAGYLPSPSPPRRCLSRTRNPYWSCRVAAPLP